MAARSKRFNSVSTSSPRFKARMGRVESRVPSSVESKSSSESGVTCACIIVPLNLKAGPYLLSKQLHSPTRLLFSVASAANASRRACSRRNQLKFEGPLSLYMYRPDRIWLLGIGVKDSATIRGPDSDEE